ncbi:hypothetical protein LSAT2_015368, partial [Lamellibrachia satsuma]
EVVETMERRKVDIACVQETRWSGAKAREIGGGFKLLYSGRTNTRNGVGIIIKDCLENILEVKRTSDRIMTVKL